MEETVKKLIVVGDGGCGKTCLLTMFTENRFLEEYIPTVFESAVKNIRVDDTTMQLLLWDTSGQEEYDRLRSIQYTGSDVVLICFSVVRPESLENVLAKWWPEVRHYCPNVPVVLVGTKNDLRQADMSHLEMYQRARQKTVSKERAEAVAKKIRAVSYVECSAKARLNIDEVFQTAGRAILTRNIKRRTFTCGLI